MHTFAAGALGNTELPRKYCTSRHNLHHNTPLETPLSGGASAGSYSTKKRKVVLNISGMIYETYTKTLDKYPETLLGTSLKRSLLTDYRTGEIFLERNRDSFDAILFYYQSSGCLIRPRGVPMMEFEKECKYFDIQTQAVKRMKVRDGFLHKRDVRIPGYKYYRDCHYTMWQFFEFPKEFSHVSAMVYFMFSFTMIIISIAVFCVESEIIIHLNGFKLEEYYHIQNSIEIAVNVFFAVELLTRLTVFPIKSRFFQKPVNVIEAISVVLFFISFWCPPHNVRTFTINVSRVLRTFRIARLARVSMMIKTSILVFKTSVKDILAVWYTILIICILCGSTMYYIEMSQPDTEFTSIPMSMWWAMQTVLCLGYGDIVPTSVMGKIWGTFMLYYGVVTVMVLVLALGSRFFDTYAKFLNMDSFLPDENANEDYEI